MEENRSSPLIAEGRLTSIKFSLASHQEICTSSISDCPISHPSQLTNPFLGLPLETGKCESCGTAEPGECDGHFGYIQLPIPVYHPSHLGELKRLLSIICLKCLRMKKGQQIRKNGEKDKSSACTHCLDMPPITVRESNVKDGSFCLELKVPKSKLRENMWNFLERYGFIYGYEECRTLLPCEVLEILKRIPAETKKKLAAKGYFPQDGYILQKLPVPPNCLSVPDISDGTTIMSSDVSVSMLKKVLKQAEIIKSSRSGPPNFESHEVEANELQSAIAQYLHVRGSTKGPRGIKSKFRVNNESDDTSAKAWIEKMKTLFISKGSGFSSRSVITGDAYKRVDEIGLPSEIAQKITFEEKVTVHNMDHLQELVDKKLCLTYRDGGSMYSLKEGSKGHTSLKVGQVVHRRIMDGDIVFINRPPSTHKHSLQAFSVYIHDEHTVKINPLICSPLGADFDGDCIHLFYPQSLAAKAEVLELFSVEQQLLSSHSGKLNLQLANDALLSLKIMFKKYFLKKATAQQLAMYVSSGLQFPALLKACGPVPQWTALQILQNALPADFDCSGERYVIRQSEIVKFDYNRDVVQSIFNDIINAVFLKKGSQDALRVFNSLQPLLMENVFSEGYSVSLEDFCIPKSITRELRKNVQKISPLLYHLRSTYNEVVELQVENHLRGVKVPVVNFILKSSTLGNLIDSKSESSINKVVQQLGFLGLQLFDRGRIYTRTLVEDMTTFFQKKFAVSGIDCPSEAFGLIRSCFFHGLNPYEKLVDSISSREVLVRSSRGLTEPGTLFKNLMAILRDVVICYDGTVRNACSNSVIQFDYIVETGTEGRSFSPAGEPVGVLAATAISNPAYKAVLDSSASSNSSWELMKEIVLCKVNMKNDLNDRRAILYLNDCSCGKKYCKENAAYSVQNHLKRRNLKAIANSFLVEYRKQQGSIENPDTNACLVGHIHLDEAEMKYVGRNVHQILQRCQEKLGSIKKKKDRLGRILRALTLSASECCYFSPPDAESSQVPCLQFSWQDTSACTLEQTSQLMANSICSILLETIVKGDPRVNMANIVWVNPDTTSWVRRPSKIQKGELAVEVVLEKEVVKQHGDTWRTVMDSCLPIIHLIDTRRSIPYGIKQLQEMIGISCAFDQAVERLTTSIRMVAKGVLKEHLILVANSMTCTGNLIGFNTGGYKALFRSLNVQIPFTEATLFTPRKCFEKAAEKCHLDSLSSTVASCSFGKRVAVGTGARFEILWNKKEMGLDQNAVDIYNFLQIVRTGTKEGEVISGCLGEEVDDMELENDYVELPLSPEHPDGGKATFDDIAEFEPNLQPSQISEGNWGNNSSQTGESGGWGEWKVDKTSGSENPGAASNSDAWAGWGSSDKIQSDNHSPKEIDNSSAPGGWNTKTQASQNDPKDSWGGQAEKANSTGGWNTKKQPSQDDPNSSAPGGWNTKSQASQNDSWGGQAEKSNSTGGWNTKKQPSQDDPNSSAPGGWNTKSHPSQNDPNDSWGGQAEKANSTGGWNTKKQPSQDDPNDSCGGQVEKANTTGGWNTQMQPSQNEPRNSWGEQAEKANTTDGWDTKTQPSQNEPRDSWGGVVDKTNTTGGWNTKTQSSQNEPRDSWGEQAEKANTTAGWNTKMQPSQAKPDDSWGGLVEKTNTTGGWNTKTPASQAEARDSWGGVVEKTNTTGGWNTQKQPQDDPSDSWGGHVEKANTTGQNGKEENGQWNQWSEPPKTETTNNKSAGTWGTSMAGEHVNQSADSQVAGSSSVGDQAEKEVQWSQRKEPPAKPFAWNTNKSSRGWGSSNTGDWKNKGRPNNPQGTPDDQSGWNSSGLYTATRQRLDRFTSEEQSALSEVDTIILAIRKIMQQSRDKDGEPLSAEDQAYVLENVFKYHPDKDVKMGCGIDHVMVSTHSSFKDTRCFYVVSTDGRKEDFSYRKCLENFVKEKHAAVAESFNEKYFKKPQPRDGGANRNRTDVGTPKADTPNN
ncbi:DNA-directed RNA polymerase V subunit 1-like isoform X1 [Papaver somniferum]|uniref:DNA-directed RNA polymerase V subunit 1-like isoform X1 n=1 Tax=Papaver somniferum TaxID=3469 RepID=UPI000E6FAFDD|nr:DNA-directed RNA polymerase V subunit 1-like isoform X1 [Papaver somniferum]